MITDAYLAFSSSPKWKVVLASLAHLAVPSSPPIPHCSFFAPIPACSEVAGAPSPAAPYLHLRPDSSPAARGSESPVGSLTLSFPCGSSSVLLLCPTLRAAGHLPPPADSYNERKGKNKGL